MKIVKSLEESGLLIKDVSGTTKSKTKQKKKRISWNATRNFRCLFICKSF